MRHDYTKPTNYILASRCSVYLNRQIKKIKKYRTSIASKHFFTCALLRNTYSFVYCCALSGPVAEIKQKELRNFIAIFCKEPRCKQRNEGKGEILAICYHKIIATMLCLCVVYTTDRRPRQTGLRIRIRCTPSWINPEKVVFKALAPDPPGCVCVKSVSIHIIVQWIRLRLLFWASVIRRNFANTEYNVHLHTSSASKIPLSK
jgi:hypothetical protein